MLTTANQSRLELYTVAAFICAGMHRNTEALDNARDVIGTGCFELVQSAMNYTELAQDMAMTGFAIVGDYPGVFEYEVAEEAGVWYVAEALATRAVPAADRMYGKLYELTVAFFSRVHWKTPDADKLHAALSALPVPDQPVI